MLRPAGRGGSERRMHANVYVYSLQYGCSTGRRLVVICCRILETQRHAHGHLLYGTYVVFRRVPLGPFSVFSGAYLWAFNVKRERGLFQISREESIWKRKAEKKQERNKPTSWDNDIATIIVGVYLPTNSLYHHQRFNLCANVIILLLQ
jgi:hypothetical protein